MGGWGTTKWRARALDHKDSRVRHERRDTKLFETSLLRGRFLELSRFRLFIHACMQWYASIARPPARLARGAGVRGRDFDLPRHSHYSGVIPMVFEHSVCVYRPATPLALEDN